VHLIIVTKYRRKVVDGETSDRRKAPFASVCGDLEARRVEMNGEADRVHLRVAYPPKVALSSLVRRLKSASSRLWREERPDLAPHDWQEMRWRPSYFAASCGGAPLTLIKPYVAQPQRPHERFALSTFHPRANASASPNDSLREPDRFDGAFRGKRVSVTLGSTYSRTKRLRVCQLIR